MPNLKRIAQTLNDLHNRTGSGFYASTGWRYFGARVSGDTLQATPDYGKTWHDVDLDSVRLSDHNGRTIEFD